VRKHRDDCVRAHGFLTAKSIGRWVFLAAVGTSLSGCLTALSPPERLYPVSQEINALRAQPQLIPDFTFYAQLTDSQRALYRNALVEARLRAADIEYSKYEEALTQERQTADLLAGTANIALTGTSALIAPVTAKNILTQVAGGITGVNGIFNDKVLLSKTIQVLQHQMRAERDRVATKIFAGMKLSSSDYSLAMALADAEDYYRAGTLAGALIDISQTVSNEAAKAKAAKNEFIVDFGFAADSAAQKLRAYVRPGGPGTPAIRANVERLAALLKQMHVKLSPFTVIDLPQFASVRIELARKAGLMP
jgi:hypothetical protein